MTHPSRRTPELEPDDPPLFPERAAGLVDDPPEVPEVFCVCDEVGQEAEPDDGEEAVAGFCEAIFCMVAASTPPQPMVYCAPADVQMLLAIFGRFA